MLPWIVTLALRMLASTWRVERPPWPVAGPCVVAFWHGDQLPMIALHRPSSGRPRLVGIASRSRDGELVAGVLERLGYGVLRGSSSRGGLEVLLGATAALGEGESPALAVDGPRGPAGTVHPGAEHLAKHAGVPVVYGAVQARGWRLRTWDRLLIPWPFARVKLAYGVWRPGEGTLAERMGKPMGGAATTA